MQCKIPYLLSNKIRASNALNIRPLKRLSFISMRNLVNLPNAKASHLLLAKNYSRFIFQLIRNVGSSGQKRLFRRVLSIQRGKGQRTVICSPVEHISRVMCARRKWSPWSMGTTGTLEAHKHTQKWKCQDWQESCRPSSPETRLAACGFALPLFVSPFLPFRRPFPLPSRLPPSLFQILLRTCCTPPWLQPSVAQTR